jgi:hypothetical protein
LFNYIRDNKEVKNMNKFLPIMVICVLVLSGLGAANLAVDVSEINETIETIFFSENLVLEKKDEYFIVDLEGVESTTTEPGKPILPIYHKIFMFSSAAKIKEVTCDFYNIKQKTINGKILPNAEPLPRSSMSTHSKELVIFENEEVYTNDDLYPGSRYEYRIRCGLNNKGTPSTFVTVEIHPVQYSPANNMLFYIGEAEIKVKYYDPGDNENNANIDSYDLVIIAPEEFSQSLQSLINHKNSNGVKTFLKTTESIFTEYTGRDKPEQIKYFIKDAKETYGIQYVLLVGGLKSYIFARDKDDRNQGSSGWHVPVRYTNIQHGSEKGVISDLYYSDLYRYNETSEEWEFEDWDSNGDGIFAKWSMMIGGRDKLDFVPDVYVGRLPCRSTTTLNTVINKIINYESTSPESKPWFKRMVGVAGRTFGTYEGQPDGEYAVDTIFDYMGSAITDPVRLYASNNDTGGLLPNTRDIIQMVSQGAGYVSLEGHGNPTAWNTHHVDSNKWVGGINIYKFLGFNNGDKLPVIIIGGCHNALFNVTLITSLLSMHLNKNNWYWTSGSPTPVCFSWALVILKKGGAIASTGCTGLGLGPVNNISGVLQNSAALEANFFYEIGQDGATTLGAAHGGAIRKFVTENANVNVDEGFCIVEYQLFGDPSLRLGGFSS